MVSDINFLLVGNSRLHWAKYSNNESQFFHTKKDQKVPENIDLDQLIWASVGKLPNFLLKKENEIKTKDINLSLDGEMLEPPIFNLSYDQYENIDNENTNTNELVDRVQNIDEDQINEENSNETSVRRLSLFDNISTDATSDAVDQKEKSEPMISEHIDEADDNENSHTPAEVEERVEPEFSATSDESDDDFNQETEEELLDIPTFLRRQAN